MCSFKRFYKRLLIEETPLERWKMTEENVPFGPQLSPLLFSKLQTKEELQKHIRELFFSSPLKANSLSHGVGEVDLFLEFAFHYFNEKYPVEMGAVILEFEKGKKKDASADGNQSARE